MKNKKNYFKERLKTFNEITTSKSVYEIANSYEESKRFSESLNEKLEELTDGVYATQSAFDIINLFKNKPKAYRVVYDKNLRYYFIGEALKYIHSDLIFAAYHQGFYYDEFDRGSKQEIVTYLVNNLETQNILMFSFFPKDFGDKKAIDDEISSDGYTNKYTYDFGTIYVHEMNEFEDFDFYNIAKPLSYKKLELPESFSVSNVEQKGTVINIPLLDIYEQVKRMFNINEEVNELDETNENKFEPSINKYLKQEINHMSKEQWLKVLRENEVENIGEIYGIIARNSDSYLNAYKIKAELEKWLYYYIWTDRIPVSKLIVEDEDIVEKEVKNYNLIIDENTKPIVVLGNWEVLDGRHRTVLAKQQGIKYLNGYVPANLWYDLEKQDIYEQLHRKLDEILNETN